MLTKETVIDSIELLEDGSIRVRQATYILEDGVRITAPIYHRAAYASTQDVSAVSPRVAAIADADPVRKAKQPAKVK